MAKISARGATEMARWKYEIDSEDPQKRVRQINVLTSDGRLLHKGNDKTYRLVGKYPPTPETIRKLDIWYSTRGWRRVTQ